MGGSRRRRRLRLALAVLGMLLSTTLLHLATTTNNLWKVYSDRQTTKTTSQQQAHVRTCRPSVNATVQWSTFPSHYPLTQLIAFVPDGLPPQYHILATNVTTTSTFNTSATQQSSSSSSQPRVHAVCKFRKLGRHVWASHTMWQQITRCTSFWQQGFGDGGPTEPVFFTGPQVPRNRPEVATILDFLHEVLRVRVITDWPALAPQGPVVVARPLVRVDPLKEHPFQGYAFTNVVQADFLRQKVYDYYGIGNDTTAAAAATANEQPRRHPRLLLLASPRLVNLAALQKDWQVALGDGARVTMVATSHLTQAPLADQIRVLAQVDILIALHDLHLAPVLLWGLPSCAGFLEVFPPYYYTPQVHGRLAASRGLSYASLYTGQDLETEWYLGGGGLHDQRLRQAESETPVCLPTKESVTVLRRLTDEWRSCRQQRADGRSSPTTATPSAPPLAVSYADSCLTVGKPEAIVTDYPTQVALKHLVQEVDHFDATGAVTVSSNPHERRAAVCVYVERGFYGHFPHAMQQFTRCFSFWQSYPDHQPYLLWNKDLDFNEISSDFINGVRQQIFGTMFGVIEIGNASEIPAGARVAEPQLYHGNDDHPEQGIFFASTEQAQLWRQTVQQHWNLTTAGCPSVNVTTPTRTRSSQSQPAIGILNRLPRSKRRLINVDALRERLRSLTDSPIEEVFLEDASFREQVTILSQIDILLSPHGAQLTSLHYMPACGGVRSFPVVASWQPLYRP
jgi:hypothetical protein